MNFRPFIVATFLFLALGLLSPAAAQLRDYEIKVTRKMLGQDRSREGENVTVREKEIIYEVTIENRRFSESPPLELHYRVFYEQSKPGSTEAPKLKSVKGKENVESIQAMRNIKIETKPVKLEEAVLDSGWVWTTGASNKSKDRVAGYWFRLYDESGTMAAEVMNPSTLSKKTAWEEGAPPK